ncbi:MAG: hypothetical protein R6W95_03555, partial [Desulfosarcina sp.]
MGSPLVISCPSINGYFARYLRDEIRTLIVVDEASRFVLSAHVVHGEHSARMAALALAKVFGGASFSGRPGLPRTLTVCDRRLFAEVESM